MPSGVHLMMRFSSFTSCKSFASPPRRPSILHMNLSFLRRSTMSRSASYPVNMKSSPCTTHRTPGSAL
eukprot:13295660-Alexandrium_andersonii.AAC.1